ncbi:MAG: hypothetical protein N3J91_09295 [Verrucomicrobiae bacterium]|nr:hypothetical protein [Verrucomicrobiae bacterium]
MNDFIKGTTRRLYLTDEDLMRLKKLSETTNLSQSEILTQIVHAGLVSIEANQNRIVFPLRFKILDREEETMRHHTPLKRS